LGGLTLKRVMVFIDGGNLYHGLRDFVGRTDVDLGKLAQKLAGDRELVRTHYYNCPVRREDGEDRYRRQQKFFDALRNLPDFEIMLGHLQQDRSGALVEKGVDVSLAVDMLSRAYKDHDDRAVLVSGRRLCQGRPGSPAPDTLLVFSAIL